MDASVHCAHGRDCCIVDLNVCMNESTRRLIELAVMVVELP
jgi:hypothetical protein